MKFVDYSYLIIPTGGGIPTAKAKELAERLQELCEEYAVKVLIAKAPSPVRDGGPMLYCSTCKEKFVVETDNIIDGIGGQAYCPFCGHNEHVRTLDE